MVVGVLSARSRLEYNSIIAQVPWTKFSNANIATFLGTVTKTLSDQAERAVDQPKNVELLKKLGNSFVGKPTTDLRLAYKEACSR